MRQLFYSVPKPDTHVTGVSLTESFVLLKLGIAAGGRIAAAAENNLRLFDDAVFNACISHMANCLIHIIGHTAKFDLTTIDDGVRRTRITVTWLADASRIDDLHVVQFQVHGYVRVADTHKIHIDMFQSLLPLLDVVTDVFIHRVAGRGMHQQESLVIEDQMARDRHLCQPCQMIIIEHVEVVRPHRRHHFSECSARSHQHALCDRMIVIAADDSGRVASYPFNTWHWISGIVNDISKEQAGIEIFVDRRQSRPVGMNVGNQQNSHCVRPEAGHQTKAGCRRNHTFVAGVRTVQ